MRRLFLTILIIALPVLSIFSQGLNIPARNWGLSFGNSTRFDGIRFNLIDKDIDKINGINFNVWGAKDDSRHTGTVRGFQLGVLNHVKSNPKGLRWLPLFNTSFGS